MGQAHPPCEGAPVPWSRSSGAGRKARGGRSDRRVPPLSRLFPADSALARPNEANQVMRMLGGNFGLDSRQRVLQLQAGTVENFVSRLERLNLRASETSALQADQVQTLRR